MRPKFNWMYLDYFTLFWWKEPAINIDRFRKSRFEYLQMKRGVFPYMAMLRGLHDELVRPRHNMNFTRREDMSIEQNMVFDEVE